MLLPNFEARDLLSSWRRARLHLIDKGRFKDRNATPFRYSYNSTVNC